MDAILKMTQGLSVSKCGMTAELKGRHTRSVMLSTLGPWPMPGVPP